MTFYANISSMGLETRLKGMIMVYRKATETRKSASLQNKGKFCSSLEVVSNQILNPSKEQKCFLIMIEDFVTLSQGPAPVMQFSVCAGVFWLMCIILWELGLKGNGTIKSRLCNCDCSEQ